MFVDSHCHLDRLELKNYDGNLAAALDAARAEGVSHFLTVSVDLVDLPNLVTIAEAHADVSFSVGTHPSDVPTDQEPSVELLCQLAQHPKVVAIGETGLDYYYTADHALSQQASFIAHIHASKQTNKPLIVHTRDARQAGERQVTGAGVEGGDVAFEPDGVAERHLGGRQHAAGDRALGFELGAHRDVAEHAALVAGGSCRRHDLIADR